MDTLKDVLQKNQLGNIGLNSGKFRLKVMIFISTSEWSHIININGRSEGTQKTVKATKTTDDAMGLQGNEGILHTC